MIHLWGISAVLAVALASNDGVCKVSEWSEWGPCTISKLCPDDYPPTQCYPLEETVWDSGRLRMAEMKEHKIEYHSKRAACRDAGQCPHLNFPPSEGFAACVNGMASTWPCRNLDLLSFTNIPDLGYPEPLPGDQYHFANDMWGWTDDVTGDLYVIIGTTGGTSFVRVTDPYNPEVLGFLETYTVPSLWRDVKVINNHAFIVSEAPGHGLQVYDMTQLRDMQGFTMLVETAHYSEFGNAHNIASNPETGYVYVIGATQEGFDKNCNGGLHIVDVNVPGNPTYTGCFSVDGYTHDTQCVVYRGPDTRYTGREICFAYNEDSLTLADVTDHANPIMVSKRTYDTGGPMYTHQGWVTEDHTIVLLDDEFDEKYSTDKYTKTYIWDITDLENPVLMNTFRSAEPVVDHNQYIKGSLTFQSNYEAGLRVLSIDQANFDLEEVAYFDTLPDSQQAEYAGTWSNYPYFEQGFVAVSSVEYGLFLLQPNYAAINQQIASGQSYAEQTRSRNIEYSEAGAWCPHRVETRNCPAGPAC